MASIKRALAAGRTQPPEQRFILLNSATWEEEIDEVLRSARQPLRNRVADPDWVAACHFLVRHCQEALGNGR
jgi:hypothetical protein